MFESFLVHSILNTLLPQYGHFKISYNTRKDKWSINELMTMCVQEEERLMMEQGENVMLVTQKKEKKGKSQASQKGKQQIPPKSTLRKMKSVSSRKERTCEKKFPTKVVPKTPFELWKCWKSSLRHMCIWGCSTISGYLIGYDEKSKGYRFYCPSHNTRIVESRNSKFLDYDLVSESNQFRNIVSDIDHTESQPTTSSDRLLVVHNTPQVQTVIEVPQVVDNISINQVDQELPHTSEQQVEPHTSLEDNGATLRRFTRTKRSAIPSDYVVYLQESDYNKGAENDPKSFSQAMSCKESELWYNVMKQAHRH
ncbi:hypothetical protein AAG906_025368 [Vitis piasezkii]